MYNTSAAKKKYKVKGPVSDLRFQLLLSLSASFAYS